MSSHQLLAACMLVVAVTLLIQAAPNNYKNHHPLFHNHMSKKVLERACAASKDAINEMMDCFKTNEELMKAVPPSEAGSCFTKAFNHTFNHSDFAGHREVICKNKDKLEDMTGCLFERLFADKNATEVQRLTEMVVDFGFCIINALD